MKRILYIFLLALLAAAAGFLYAAHTARAEVGGHRTSLAQLVDITYDQGSMSYSCSGSIISPDVVLTAAHCAGGHNYFVSNRMHGGWSAQPPVIAPGYSDKGYVNDLAVLRLDHNVAIKPLPVASTPAAPGSPAMSYGWGDTKQNADDAGDSPRQLGFTVQSTAWCYSMWSTDMMPSAMCASSSGTIASGDSGGPLIANGQVVGINDQSADAVIYPSIFTRTDLFAGWIHAEVKRMALQFGVAAQTGMSVSGTASGRG